MGANTGGNNTIGYDNIMLGSYAGRDNITGYYNIFLGFYAGSNNYTGNSNVFLGTAAGNTNYNGFNNVCLGTSAGYTNSNGSGNVLIGLNSGYKTIADNNLFFGNYSGLLNTTGNANVFFGNNAGHNNTTGYNNYFTGLNAGYTNTVGNYNTYIGVGAGQTNNGSGNIFFGSEVEVSTVIASTFTNKFAIYKSTTTGITSNTSANCNVLIGGDLTTGSVGIGTLDPDSYTTGIIFETAIRLVVVGKILATTFISFTGSHKIILDDTININELQLGMIMSANGNAILYDINNSVVTVCISSKGNDKAIFGVYSGSEDTIITNPLSENSNTTITTYYANSLGEGGILVSNYSGYVQNGDYITSCIIPGYGALQSDDLMHSYTVAKCTQNIDWSIIPENVLCPIDGIMYKSLLASCTYHSG